MPNQLTAARALAAALTAGLLWIPTGSAQEAAADKKTDASAAAPKKEPTPAAAADIPPAPAAAVSRHRITLGGKPVAYTATAGTVDLKNDEG